MAKMQVDRQHYDETLRNSDGTLHSPDERVPEEAVRLDPSDSETDSEADSSLASLQKLM